MMSPGAGWGSVAVQDFGAVGVPGGGGAVGIQYQRPAPPVNHDLVVVRAQQHAISEAGGATVSFVLDMVYLTGGGWLVAAAQTVATTNPDRAWWLTIRVGGHEAFRLR
jgi:hypothetical protein